MKDYMKDRRVVRVSRSSRPEVFCEKGVLKRPSGVQLF